MRAVLTKAWSEVRRRRVQSAVIVLMVTLASGTITLGLTLLQQAGSPYDRAFEAQEGAHLEVFYDAGKVAPDELASTPATLAASSSAGPWPDLYATLLHRESQERYQLDLVGRDGPQGAAEVLRMTSGRWVQAPGEVVVDHAFAKQNAIRPGDHLVSLNTADKPVLTVVGVAVDVDRTSAGTTITTTQRAWVLPEQAAYLAGRNGLGYEMAYRFPSAPSRTQLGADMGRLQDALPAGAVKGSLNYLAMRDAYNVSNQFLLVLLIAFGVTALAASLATVVNLVLGTVLASFREIGIIKALGFTPSQVVATLVVGMAIPALAGCVIGIPAGTAVSIPLVDQAARGLDLPSPPAVSPLAGLLTLAGILVSVATAAALPALRAGRMSPVAAIAGGGAPRSPRAWRASRQLRRLRLPRPLSLGAGDAFARPLRAALTVLAVLVGVTTIVVAASMREAIPRSLSVTAGLNGDVSVSRGDTVSDQRVVSILTRRPEAQQVVAVAQGAIAVPGLADPVDGLAFRDDPRGLGWSAALVRGRWLSDAPGEVLLTRRVLDQAHLDVGSTFDGVIAGHTLRLHVVGEVGTLSYRALLGWSTLTAATPDAQPDRYLVHLRPGSDANDFAATVRAQEPDFLTVSVSRVGPDSDGDAINTVMSILSVVLGLIAAVGVFCTMLLHVRERSRHNAILKAVGMTPGQLLVMVMTSSLVLGVVGGLVGTPAGANAYRGLLIQLAHGIGISPPPFGLDVLGPMALYPLGLTGVAIALAGALLPARRAARIRAAEILRSE
jgi:putative ABC transport system permease protein